VNAAHKGYPAISVAEDAARAGGEDSDWDHLSDEDF
jgi:hypothetical protein